MSDRGLILAIDQGTTGSTALLIARQIYAPEVRVRAFGWPAVNFKTPDERKDMRTTFEQCGVEIE